MKNTNTPIQLFKVWMNPNAKVEVSKVLDSGYIGQGQKVEQFEKDLKNYLNIDSLLTLNSGTSGLHLALHLLKKPKTSYTDSIGGMAYVHNEWPGIQPGDEILTTALTCTASNWPILANGLRIKWVDINPKTFGISLVQSNNIYFFCLLLAKFGEFFQQ